MRLLRKLSLALALVLTVACSPGTTPPAGSPTAAPPATDAPTTDPGEGTPTPAATSACLPSPAGTDAPTVKIAVSRGLVHAPTWNLVTVGPRYGFNVEMVIAFTYADQQRAVAAGDTDVATTGVNMPSIALANNVTNLRVIAGQHWGGQNLVMRDGVSLDSWTDLEGKTIGVAPGTWARVLFLIAADQNGVDLNAVNLTNIEAAGATALQALQRGEVDGIVLFSPTIDQAVVEGYGYYPENVDIGDADLGDANGAIYANTTFLEDRELAQNYVCAFAESLNEMATDEEAFVALSTEVAGVTEDVAREAYQHMRFSYNIPREAIIGAAALGPEFGYAPEDYSDQVTELLDYSLLQAATGMSEEELSQPPTR